MTELRGIILTWKLVLFGLIMGLIFYGLFTIVFRKLNIKVYLKNNRRMRVVIRILILIITLIISIAASYIRQSAFLDMWNKITIISVLSGLQIKLIELLFNRN